MRKATFFQLLCLSFITGIILAELFRIELIIIYILFSISILIILFIAKKIVRQVSLILILLLLGYYRYHLNIPVVTKSDIQYYNNQAETAYSDLKLITFTGLVNDNPQRRLDHQKIIISSLLFNQEKISGLVLIKVPLYPKYTYGDQLQITCALQVPMQFEKFDYAKYLARYHIYSVCYNAQIKVVKQNQGNVVKAKLMALKLKIEDTINKNLVEPQSSILVGLLIGTTYGIDPELGRNFNLTGTSHIIAISGMHITLLASYVMNILLSLGCWRKTAFYSTTAFIIFYVSLIGFMPSAVRAGIMGFLVLLALNIGRVNLSLNSIFFAGAIMVLINPLTVIVDLGFQFSFLAVLGLIYFQKSVEKVFYFLPTFLGIKENLSTTLAAQILTLPWLVFKLGNLSLIAPVANLLILPLSAPMIICGLLAVIIGLILPIMAPIFFWLNWVILGYFVIMVEKLSGLKYSFLIINNFPVWLLVAIYLGIIGFIFYSNKKTASVIRK
jgi:competence protein ComEC